MILLACLGNPGDRYEKTRHNMGFLIGKKLKKAWAITDKSTKHKAKTFKGHQNGLETAISFPQTYMNLCGEAISLIKGFYKLQNQQIIAIYDDVDLPFGQIRYRASGGPGTHNGMKSLIQHLGGKDFHRIRIGVGPKPDRQDLAAFVLSNLPEIQLEHIDEISEICKQMIEDLSLNKHFKQSATLPNNVA